MPGVDSFTKLMLHGNKTNGSTTRLWSAVSGAKISTAQSKFNGSSLLLNGTSDYISSADSADFTTGTSDFTWEFWTYFNTIPSTWSWLSQGNSNTVTSLWLFDSNNLNNAFRFYVENGAGTTLASYTANFTWATSTWYHIALVRQSGTIYVFINGVSQTLSVNTAISGATSLPDYTGNMFIGARSRNTPDNFFPGYIEEVRFSKDIARYTANFSPATIPFKSDTNTVMLLHLDGTNASTVFPDSAGGDESSEFATNFDKEVTFVGDAKISTAQSKFGGASLIFDGSGDYVTIPDSADWDFGTGDFTIDFWINHSGGTQAMYYNQDNSSNWFYLYRETGNIFYFYVGTASVITAQYTASFSPTNGVWYHLEWVRQGSNVYFFVNGVSQSLTINTAIGATAIPNIPSVVGIGRSILFNSYHMNGYIEEFRISKGIARHTANFTPSTVAYDAGSGIIKRNKVIIIA